MARTRRSTGSRSGFTVIEISIALLLLGLVMGFVLHMVRAAESGYRGVSAATDLNERGAHALDEVRRRLQDASLVTITPQPAAPAFFTTRLDFQRIVNLGGTLSPVERISLELAPGELNDGLDNNGDGVADERRIVWTEQLGLPGQRQSVLASDVREFLFRELPNGADDNGNGTPDESGLCFNFEGRTLHIQLTIERRDASGMILSSHHRTSLSIHN